MMCSSKLGCGKEEMDIEDDSFLFPCCSLFLLTVLFLLQVTSISRFNGTRLFPRTQAKKNTTMQVIKAKELKQKLKIKE